MASTGTLRKGTSGSKDNLATTMSMAPSSQGATPQTGRQFSPTKKGPPHSNLDPKKSTKCTVLLLDGTEENFLVNPECEGQELLDVICDYLEITEKAEKDYFGVTYKVDKAENIPQAFVDPKKPLAKQLKKMIGNKLEFRVKFYPSDPTALVLQQTKYLITCQVRQDILSGKLPCTFLTYAVLGSYNAQADLGDYPPGSIYPQQYYRNMPFAPQQYMNPELFERIAELHSVHTGMGPDYADLYFLDQARRLALYGIHFYECKSNEGEDVRIGVFHGGFVVYKGAVRLYRHSWPKIMKLTYDKKQFVLTRRPHEGEKGDVDEIYKLDSFENAKRLWKVVVDHHTFFRMHEQKGPSRPLLNARNPQYNPNARRPGDDDYGPIGAGGGDVDWSNLPTLPRPGGGRQLDNWGELENIDPSKRSQSKGSLGETYDRQINRQTANANNAPPVPNAAQIAAQQQQAEMQRKLLEQQQQQAEMQRKLMDQQQQQQQQAMAEMQRKLLEQQQQQEAMQRQLQEQQRQAEQMRKQQELELQHQREEAQAALLAAQKATEDEKRRAQEAGLAAQKAAEEEKKRLIEAAQRAAEEEKRRLFEAAQKAAEEERRRAIEAAQKAAEEERRRALEAAAAEEANYQNMLVGKSLAGVDPALSGLISQMLRNMSNEAQLKKNKEIERHERVINQAFPVRGIPGPDPSSFNPGSGGNRRTVFGAGGGGGGNVTSLYRLNPRQIQLLYKMQVGDPEEELSNALGSLLDSLGHDANTLVIGDTVPIDSVKSNVELPPLPPGGLESGAAAGMLAAANRASAKAAFLGEDEPVPIRASRPPAPARGGQTLI